MQDSAAQTTWLLNSLISVLSILVHLIGDGYDSAFFLSSGSNCDLTKNVTKLTICDATVLHNHYTIDEVKAAWVEAT